MQAHSSEGLATLIGSESCVYARESMREALTGERIGQPLSGENSIWGADALEKAEGNMDRRARASVCPTLRRLRPWKRMHGGCWRYCRSDCEVWSEPAPGEDPIGGFSQSTACRGRRLAIRAQLRAAGVHSFLGALQEGALGGATQDGQGPFHPCATGSRSLVPSASSLAGGGPASGLASQASGSLRLLRHHGQWAGARPLSLRSLAPVAQVARSPLVACPDDVGQVCPSGCSLSAPPTACRSQYLPPCSDSIVRGAGCPSWARPDL